MWYAVDHDGGMEAPRGQWVRDGYWTAQNSVEAAEGYVRVVSTAEGATGDLCVDLARRDCGSYEWYGTATVSLDATAEATWGVDGCVECGDVYIDGEEAGTICR